MTANGEQSQVCDESDSTWTGGAELDSPTAQDLSAYLDRAGVSTQLRTLEDLDPRPVATRAQKIRDMQSKKPRRELRARIIDYGGDVSALAWVNAFEYDELVAPHTSNETGVRTIGSINTPPDARTWQTVQPFGDALDAVDIAPNHADEIYVHFGLLGDHGLARLPIAQVSSNGIAFARAAANYVAFGAPDLSSWLGVDTEESVHGVLLSARGDYWRPHLGIDPSDALAAWQDRSFELEAATVALSREAIADVLRHHHLDFWDGSRKRIQTFFAGRPPIDEVVAIIGAVLKQNRVMVIDAGPHASYHIEGEVDGADYAVGITAGAVRTAYPLWI